MLQMNLRITIIAGCLMTFGCWRQSLEQSFFDKPSKGRLERIRQYSLEDQYKIFRYGNDRIEPPIMELADPIAEKGASAIVFLRAQLDPATDDRTIRDILLIFETMARARTYNVRSDTALMIDLTSKVAQMKDKEWRAICMKMLQRIKDLQ
jgi:hypothetical protein